MTTTRTEYVAVQVAGGGLWHAAEWMKGDEHARTLCGRTASIEPTMPSGEPQRRLAGLYGPDSAHQGSNTIGGCRFPASIHGAEDPTNEPPPPRTWTVETNDGEGPATGPPAEPPARREWTREGCGWLTSSRVGSCPQRG